MEDPELYDARNEMRQQQYAAAKQKEKVRKHRRK